MKKTNKFSPEMRERAVRMVQEQRGDYPSLWAAIESMAPKIGCVPQTVNEWVKSCFLQPSANCDRKRYRSVQVPCDDPYAVASNEEGNRCFEPHALFPKG